MSPAWQKIHEQAAVAASPAPTPQFVQKAPEEEKESVPREAVSTPTPPPVVEKRETPVAAQPSTTPLNTPPVIAEKPSEPPAQASEAPPPAPSVAPSSTPPVIAQKEAVTPPAPQPTPPAIPTPKPLHSPPKGSKVIGKPKRTVDDSLRALAGPPSSLRKSSVSEAQAKDGAAANPPLSKEEVTDLANTVARTHGYNLGDFEHASPEYNEVDDSWSVSYDEKTGDTSGSGKHFSVRVDGRTKKSTLLPPP